MDVDDVRPNGSTGMEVGALFLELQIEQAAVESSELGGVTRVQLEDLSVLHTCS